MPCDWQPDWKQQDVFAYKQDGDICRAFTSVYIMWTGSKPLLMGKEIFNLKKETYIMDNTMLTFAFQVRGLQPFEIKWHSNM